MFTEYLEAFCDVLMLCQKSAPAHFLPIMVIHSIIGTLKGICNSINGAPLVRHLALIKNESDVAAKEGNQSRMLKLVAIIGGYYFLQYTNQDVYRSFMAFVFLVSLKIFCQYKATNILELRTLNFQTTEILFNQHMKSFEKNKENPDYSKCFVAKNECFYTDFRFYIKLFSTINVGVSVEKISNSNSVLNLYEKEKYGISVDFSNKQFDVVLLQGCDSNS